MKSTPPPWNTPPRCTHKESHHENKSNLFFDAYGERETVQLFEVNTLRYKCVRSDSMSQIMKKWNYIDIKKLVFLLSLSFIRCHTYITRKCLAISRKRERERECMMRKGGKRKIYVRNKCVNMSDTTFLSFLLFWYMLQFSFGKWEKRNDRKWCVYWFTDFYNSILSKSYRWTWQL